MNVVLHTDRASYRVGNTTLLHNITLQLTKGTLHALVGPNGAGKSTLLQLLAADIAPTSGDVFFGAKRIDECSKRELALKRAVMPQDVVLSFAFTSEEVVMMGRYPHMLAGNRTRTSRNGPHDRVTERDDGAIVAETMRVTESQPLRDRLYPTLSGGEQARVTLARVLAQATPVILLDEPTASLDPRHQHLVMRLAKQHAKGGGTVLAVLHDLNLAAAYADDIILMNAGRIRACGPPIDVLEPSILEEVFQTNFHVTDHPRFPHPLVLSLPVPD